MIMFIFPSHVAKMLKEGQEGHREFSGCVVNIMALGEIPAIGIICLPLFGPKSRHAGGEQFAGYCS